MDEQITWGLLLREWRKTRLDMNIEEMVADFSLWKSHLSDEQISDLLQLGIDLKFSLSYDILNKFETQPDRMPTNHDRWKILSLICYFRTRGLLQPEEANQWLDLAGLASLRQYEREYLFGDEERWTIQRPRFRKNQSLVAYVSNQFDRVVIENPRLNGVSQVVIRFVDSPTVPLILLALLIALLLNAPKIVTTIKSLFDQPTPTPKVMEVTPFPSATPAFQATVTPQPTVSATVTITTSTFSINAASLPQTTLPLGTHRFEGVNEPGTHVEIFVNGTQDSFMSEMPTNGTWSIDAAFDKEGVYSLDVIEVAADGVILQNLERFTVTVSSSISAVSTPTPMPILSNFIQQPPATVSVKSDYLTISETTYITAVNQIVLDVSRSVATLEILLEKEHDIPRQFEDPEWQTEIQNVANEFRDIAERTSKITAPEAFGGSSKPLSAIVSELDDAATILTDTISSLDETKLSRANIHLNFLHGHLSTLVRMLEQEIGFIQTKLR